MANYMLVWGNALIYNIFFTKVYGSFLVSCGIVIKYHELFGLNNAYLFVRVLIAGSPRHEPIYFLMSALFLAWRWWPFHCLHLVKRENASVSSCSYKCSNDSIARAPPSWSHLNQSSPKGPISKYHLLES